MKRKYIAILAVFVFIVFFFSMEARAVDWKLYAKSTDGTSYFYCDSQSIKRVSKDVVRAWGKTVYTKKGVQEMIKEMGPEFKELSYDIHLLEYNCSEKKGRVLHLTVYNQNDRIINSIDFGSPSWDFVIPGSSDETLSNIICGGR